MNLNTKIMQSGKSRCEAVAKATGCAGLRLSALAASCVFGLQEGYRTATTQSSVSNPYGGGGNLLTLNGLWRSFAPCAISQAIPDSVTGMAFYFMNYEL